MRRRNTVTGIGVLVLVALFIASGSLYAQEKSIKLRLSNFHPPTHPVTKLTQEWAKEVEKQTNGRVKVTVFPGSTLTPPMQTYDSVVKGIADIGMSMFAYSPGRFPLSEILQRPLGFADGYQATKVANAYFKQFKPKELDDTQVMYLHGGSNTQFSTRPAISSVDDIKNLRIICNADSAAMVTALGGAPVTIPVTDSYDALNKGLCDGVLFVIEAMKGFKIAEVVKYSLVDRAVVYSAGHYVVMNKDKWNSISNADQKIIEKINEEWIEKQGRQWAALEKDAMEYAAQKGVKFVYASKEQEARTAERLKPVLDKYVSDMKAKGLPGDEVLKFCLNYIKTHP